MEARALPDFAPSVHGGFSAGIHTIVAIPSSGASQRINPLLLGDTNLTCVFSRCYYACCRDIDSIECVHQKRICMLSDSLFIMTAALRLTRKTDHAIMLRHSADGFLGLGFLAVVPCILVSLRCLREVRVQLCGCLVVLRNRLTAACAEAVFI